MAASKGTALLQKLRRLGKAQKTTRTLPLKDPEKVALNEVFRQLPKYGVKTIFMTGGSLRYVLGQQKNYRDVDLVPVVTNKQLKERFEEIQLELRRRGKRCKDIDFPAIFLSKSFAPRQLVKEIKYCSDKELDHLFMIVDSFPIYESKKREGEMLRRRILASLIDVLGKERFARKYNEWNKRMLKEARRGSG